MLNHQIALPTGNFAITKGNLVFKVAILVLIQAIMLIG